MSTKLPGSSFTFNPSSTPVPVPPARSFWDEEAELDELVERAYQNMNNMGGAGINSVARGAGPVNPAHKPGDLLKDRKCPKCGNTGHVRVRAVEDGKAILLCKLCGKETRL